MKENATKAEDEIKVGSIVKVPLKDVDCTKVDGKNLILVVVEVVRPRCGSGAAKYRLACAKGPLQNLYTRVYCTPVPNGSMKMLGLDAIFNNWGEMKTLTEREAAASTSLVGGQGKKDRCGCKGACDTKRCACFKAKRFCGSSCHKGNTKCTNHPNVDHV